MCKIILTTLFCFLLITNVFAANGGSGDGGWISSGGEIYKDAHNPWFIQNTSKVYWCLSVAPGKVSVSSSQISNVIYKSLDYWRMELNQNSDSVPTFPTFSTGQQEFIQVGCDFANLDLKIIFGREALSEKEFQFLGNPDRYVGVSVRTEYNQKTLKGKGFIYFSADQDPINMQIPANLWTNERVLQYAISHEFGHVFGIPHSGSGLMAEHFLELVANPNLTEYFNRLPMNNFLLALSSFNACGWMVNSSYFGLPSEEGKPVWCVKVKENKNSGVFDLTAFRAQANPEVISLGQFVPDKNDMDIQKMLGEEYPFSFLYLTKEQEVFDRRSHAGVMVGPKQFENFFRAEWRSSAGAATKPVYIIAQAKYFRVIGIEEKDGKAGFTKVLSYSSQINRIFSTVILMP